MARIRVAVNGFGTIGKRVAEAILKQPDMELVGVVKTKPDYVAKHAVSSGIPLYTLSDRLDAFREKNIPVEGSLEDLLEKVDVVVDATPGGVGKEYKPLYERFGVKAIFQGGEKPEVAEVSFNTLCNYEEALGKRSVRVVSCNTTGLLRSICSLSRIAKIKKVRATMVRRASDPKEVKRGPVNAIVPNPVKLPSHHALDVKTVLPTLDIVTTAVVVPTTLMHVHIVFAELEDQVSREDIVATFEQTPRILLADASLGLTSTADLVEYARDLGRKRYDIPELVIWLDSIAVLGREVMWMQAVHQESIVVPENIDAIRAVMEAAKSAEETIRITDETLGIMHGRIP
ncbi:NAD(P)-dependent glyceraldehyde 3-phosphate dehydrogenase [Pyrodictium delaneyi]|uniref:Glyceraldehyde-3-phosphate dehydrogenase n=1 Tax=Pyrodictium delaneyi TaxID=1273541 RepID=A0A0P0N5G2_9CREN|nr:type II glyceraldehyde-3-phosphate dehydrogenase [Pyrodictium delaneyi]ALL01716.1 NAD(P)-dependent glyceraldehyde 3-phosphate dehydrogenase [Pyrodictium delaneyi]OWJ55057.1 glyceraldehyde-3-phosphate dehydrogenase [Pyrodictium delaneyi]